MSAALSANPVYANVAFLRIPEFDARSVTEQASLKDRLEGRVKAALAPVAARDRAVLDTDDGVALVLFGDCARALRIAQSLRGEEAFLQVGLNYGPLALTSPGPEGRVFGDGLASAAAAARFATPDKILVTQDFVRALEANAPALAAELTSAGEFTDTRVRQHQLYTPDPVRGAQRRRRILWTTVGGVAAILFLGIFAREANRIFFPPRPAIVTLAVKPRGEVFVNGISKGVAPPLKNLELEAGKHVITIRNAGSPPLEIALNLKSGEETTITHTFAAPRPPAQRKPQQKPEQKPDFWRDFKNLFGGT
jgi:hypothetical protein